VTKDPRIFIPLKDPAMQGFIKNALKQEGMTYEKLMHRYFKMPDTAEQLDILHNKFDGVVEGYSNLVPAEAHDDAEAFMSYMWVLIAKTANGSLDPQKIMTTIETALNDDLWASSSRII